MDKYKIVDDILMIEYVQKYVSKEVVDDVGVESEDDDDLFLVVSFDDDDEEQQLVGKMDDVQGWICCLFLRGILVVC